MFIIRTFKGEHYTSFKELEDEKKFPFTNILECLNIWHIEFILSISFVDRRTHMT